MKVYWDQLFKERTTKFRYEESLDEDVLKFKPGKLLDIGAGDGRNAQFLKSCGFDVTCTDYSQEGLNKIKNSFDKILFDVYRDDLELFHTHFDTITMIHFFPDVDVLQRLTQLLTPDGVLYGLTFINDELDRHSSKYSIGISRREIKELNERFLVISEEVREDERGELYMFLIKVENSDK